MPEVESSVIQSAEYEEALRRLRIVFVSGKVYTYLDVPGGVYRDFLAAPSMHRSFAISHSR